MTEFDAGRVKDALMMLDNAARDLNDASDEMNAHVAAIDAALKSLGCGVAAWVTLSAGDKEAADAATRQLGYAKVNGRWCVALRQARGVRGSVGYSEDVWPFTEAARWMRADSVHRLPDLLDALLRNVREMTERMRTKSELAKAFADAVAPLAKEKT
jgi:hypothetical protein